MKTITFTLQIQADRPRGSRTRKAVALKLCRDINGILIEYDGVTGAAQIIPAPRKIMLTNTPVVVGKNVIRQLKTSASVGFSSHSRACLAG